MDKLNDMEVKEIKVKFEKTITLNSSDRFYQDVATVNNDPFYSVYTLVNENTGGNFYAIVPTVNMATFTNKQDADMYHAAVVNMMEYQNTHIGYQKIREWLTEDIEKFRNAIKSIQQNKTK